MKQIIVIGDNSSSNLGDPILTQSAYYTVCRAVEGMDYVVSIFDIAGRKKQKSMTSISPPTHKYTQIPSVTKASSFSVLSNCIKVDVKCLVKWYLREKNNLKSDLNQALNQKVLPSLFWWGSHFFLAVLCASFECHCQYS